MENLYETLLGRPQPREAPAERKPFAWDAADGAGPDRLFNRYRRLRLDARAGDLTLRCPATPSAIPA
jgi:hypothetical protein